MFVNAGVLYVRTKGEHGGRGGVDGALHSARSQPYQEETPNK